MQIQQISIVIPVFNDAAALARLLPQLPAAAEIVVVDGGSEDLGSVQWPAHIVWQQTPQPSRGAQLCAGIEAAQRPWLWLLHADSAVSAAMLSQLVAVTEPGWGRFDVSAGDRGAGLRLVAAMMNLRSRWTAICTGDQGIFVHRALLDAAGGMPSQPLMEDIELSRRLRRLGRPQCLPGKLQMSVRRWQQQGLVRTILNMWWLRLRYWLGANPARLAARYYS
ncbi:MAG: TIGR04283 family arsenosugar biosynthesis glycosyltransferase [Pseudomonadales bacterium]